MSSTLFARNPPPGIGSTHHAHLSAGIETLLKHGFNLPNENFKGERANPSSTCTWLSPIIGFCHNCFTVEKMRVDLRHLHPQIVAVVADMKECSTPSSRSVLPVICANCHLPSYARRGNRRWGSRFAACKGLEANFFHKTLLNCVSCLYKREACRW